MAKYLYVLTSSKSNFLEGIIMWRYLNLKKTFKVGNTNSHLTLVRNLSLIFLMAEILILKKINFVEFVGFGHKCLILLLFFHVHISRRYPVS